MIFNFTQYFGTLGARLVLLYKAEKENQVSSHQRTELLDDTEAILPLKVISFRDIQAITNVQNQKAFEIRIRQPRLDLVNRDIANFNWDYKIKRTFLKNTCFNKNEM